MLESAKEALVTVGQWSPLFYLAVGTVLGALLSSWMAISATHPRLLIAGGGGGGGNGHQSWNVSIVNRPSFLGMPWNGSTAIGVVAHIHPKLLNAPARLLYWHGQQQPGVDIAPGQTHALRLFEWRPEHKGYFVADQHGNPVALFSQRETKFVLRTYDRLNRKTDFKIKVRFDDSSVGTAPSMTVVYPMPTGYRWSLVRRAAAMLWQAISKP